MKLLTLGGQEKEAVVMLAWTELENLFYGLSIAKLKTMLRSLGLDREEVSFYDTKEGLIGQIYLELEEDLRERTIL